MPPASTAEALAFLSRLQFAHAGDRALEGQGDLVDCQTTGAIEVVASQHELQRVRYAHALRRAAKICYGEGKHGNWRTQCSVGRFAWLRSRCASSVVQSVCPVRV